MNPPSDPRPAEITYTFDHNRLRRYLRLKGLLGWVGALGLLGGFFGFIAAADTLDRHGIPLGEKLRTAAVRTGVGLAGGTAFGAFCYLVLTHRRSAAEASAVSLRVEGPFVRVTSGGITRIDRKLHFRSIIDYSLVDGPLRRRLGLKTLVMTVPVGAPNVGAPGGLVLLTGLRDCERVRDELAALDAAREHLNA